MKTYLVGGAVRDALMGLPMRDRDWVVVGATPQQMLDLGFTQVGRDFPVFLHPVTKDEYALARTERSTAPGYRGFAVHTGPGVTLEDDLARRDLTINAIAMATDAEHLDGHVHPEQLIDPYGGRDDLAQRVLRHVTPAFREDPVRILRVARFAARFFDYRVAPETMALMCEMVDAGDVDHLVAERVWQELARGLMESHPSRMFEVLRACGALRHLLPELDRLWGVPQSAEHHPEVDTGVHVMMVLDMAAQLQASLNVRWACLMHDLGKGTTPTDLLPRHIGHEGRSVRMAAAIAQKLRVPQHCQEVAEAVAREHGHIHRSGDLGADATLRLLERCDALRKPTRFAEILQACECDARGRLDHASDAYPPRVRLTRALDTVLAVPTRAIAQAAMARGEKDQAVGRAIRAARLHALDKEMHKA